MLINYLYVTLKFNMNYCGEINKNGFFLSKFKLQVQKFILTTQLSVSPTKDVNYHLYISVFSITQGNPKIF